MKWLKKDTGECQTCAYLKAQIEIIRGDWRAEREEYKRAIDRLLEKAGSGPVGQGESKPVSNAMPQNIFDIFEEKDEVAN